MKKTFTLFLLFIGIQLFSQPLGWIYNQPITVQNSNATNAVDYQLRIVVNTQSLIAANKMTPTGSDIRFSGACTSNAFFNYWIEGGINTTTTTIWVKIPLIAANTTTTIFMFYGNPSATPASTVHGTFRGPNSATDSVFGGASGGMLVCQRGFRFAPTQDILVTHFGKNEPSGTTRYVTLFDFTTQAILTQTQVSGPAATYSYGAITNPLWLTNGTQYVLQIYGLASDGYYYGTSSQIGQHLTYFDMRYSNGGTQNTFPNNSLANYHYGYGDFWYYIRSTMPTPLTYTLGGSLINITPSSPAICSGNSVTLTTNASGTFSWNTLSTSSVIVESPTTTTTYSVAESNLVGCNSIAVITITVQSAVPSLTVVNSASASAGICPFKTATLTASGATSYTWAGATPVTNGVSFSPTTTSDYTVTGGNACGTSSAVTSISIHPTPVVNAAASSASLCSGLSLTLTSTGNYTNHTWAGGYQSGVGFFPTLTNTYIVTGTTALSCTNTAAVAVTIVPTPALAPTYPSLICFGQTATLSATGATNYTWLPVASSASNAPSVTVSPAVTTTYTVIKSNANCVDTKTFVLNVNALPGVFAIVTPTVVCALKTATLFGGGALTFTWTAPSFSTNVNSPIVAPSVPTTYTIVGSDGICTNTTTVFLAVDPNPTVTASANPSVICLGETTTLTANGGVNYTWTATTGTVFTATHTDSPIIPTLYTLTGDNSFGCTASANQIVLVNQLPPVSVASNKTLVCVAGDAKLTASGASSYLWDPGAGSAITPTVMVNPLTTTSYTVEGTNTSTGCKNKKSITITVFEPTVAVSSPTSTCFGGNITISASGATSYTWHLGNGVTHAFATALVNPTIVTIYTVTALTSTTGGLSCPSTNTTSVDIFYNPTITATPQRPTICKNETVQLYSTGGNTYSWNDPQSQTGATITVAPQLQTTYTVTGTDVNGCVSTGTVLIKVSPCVGINEFNGSSAGIAIYPNPNNGEFVIESVNDIKLTLLNELGQLIKTFDLSGSNKKAVVTNLPAGIYFITGQKDNVKLSEKIIVTK